jgi:hypothetical protein
VKSLSVCIVGLPTGLVPTVSSRRSIEPVWKANCAVADSLPDALDTGCAVVTGIDGFTDFTGSCAPFSRSDAG